MVNTKKCIGNTIAVVLILLAVFFEVRATYEPARYTLGFKTNATREFMMSDYGYTHLDLVSTMVSKYDEAFEAVEEIVEKTLEEDWGAYRADFLTYGIGRSYHMRSKESLAETFREPYIEHDCVVEEVSSHIVEERGHGTERDHALRVILRVRTSEHTFLPGDWEYIQFNLNGIIKTNCNLNGCEDRIMLKPYVKALNRLMECKFKKTWYKEIALVNFIHPSIYWLRAKVPFGEYQDYPLYNKTE